MPEENAKDRSSSGNKPGEKKPTVIGENKDLSKPPVLTPTVLGKKPASPPPASPTVIGGGRPPAPKQPAKAHQELKPTVLGGGAPPASTRPAGSATIGGGQPAQTATLQVEPTAMPSTPPATPVKAKPPVVTHPSAMPGTVRKVVEVEVSALEKLFPGTPVEILTKARLILGATVLELLTDAKCMQWGEDEQRCFGQLTDKSTQLIGNQAVQDGGRHLVRLNAILTEIGDALKGKPNGGGLFRRAANPKKEFEEHIPELNQLKALLEKLLPRLNENRSDLAALSAEFEELSVKLAGSSIAARYIADQLQSDNKMAHFLTERSNSLTEAAAYIQQGNLLRKQTLNNVDLLIAQVRDTVLTRVPVWLESVTVVLQKPTQTDTDLYGLRQGLDGILIEIGRN